MLYWIVPLACWISGASAVTVTSDAVSPTVICKSMAVALFASTVTGSRINFLKPATSAVSR